MTFPEWTKPGVYGALVGAVAVSVLGFTWGGWTTSGGALEMADNFAAEQVTLAMVPVCLGLSEADAERVEILATLREASGFQQRNAMMETGWATLPGTDAPSRDLADACLAELAANLNYATNPARVANRASLTKTLAAATAGCSRVDLISALSQAGVPAGPIDTVAETIGDLQIVARGLQIAPEGIPGLRTPLRFSRSPLVLDRAAPALGAAESTLKTR